MQPNKIYGNLTTIEPVKGGKFWLCKCKCGKTTKASKWHLQKGLRKTCGCRIKQAESQIKCVGCKQLKKRSEFYLRKNGTLHRRRCKNCCITESRIASTRRQRRLRFRALFAYGGECPNCDCCGENKIEFLVIDHKDGGGNAHRKEENITNIYRWLRSNNYPDGFRILCHNCNFSLGLYGYCPHNDDHSLDKQFAIATASI